MSDNKLIGNWGEKLASALLYSKGYQILDQNFRCKLGEVDLIVQRDDVISFVEVKTREDDVAGVPAEAVGKEKQQRIRRIAEYYLMKNRIRDVYVSFQVIQIRIDHIENAF